jgi:hypothetical protein
MRLICYATSGAPPIIVPAPVERYWMDQTDGQAYRCLPLNIANAHGWLILNTTPFEAEWDGGSAKTSVVVRGETDAPLLAESHFGAGVLTFHVNGLFRTEPGYDLMVTGPINMPKDSIQPLSGIVETDWAPFTFTMNWRFTRPRTPIRFTRDEPFCMIYPLRRGLIDDIEPEIRPIEADPEIHTAFTTWSDSRRGFNRDLTVPGSDARKQKWQKDYFRGDSPFAEGPPDHRTKLRPKPFTVLSRWQPGGLLDQLRQEQTDENRAGRQRLAEGVLTPSPATVAIDADTTIPLDTLDFVCAPDFLTAAESAVLAEAARALTNSAAADADYDPASDHVALFEAIERQRPEAASLIRDLQQRIAAKLGLLYDLTMPVFSDSAQLICLTDGMSVDCHAACEHADGAPHATPHRDFASIIYLNDDFTGGELYFAALDLAVRPRAGMLLAFTGGWHHEHGIAEIASGEQLALTAFHTFDSRMRDRKLMALTGQPA